jgi:hypothetical protein
MCLGSCCKKCPGGSFAVLVHSVSNSNSSSCAAFEDVAIRSHSSAALCNCCQHVHPLLVHSCDWNRRKRRGRGLCCSQTILLDDQVHELTAVWTQELRRVRAGRNCRWCRRWRLSCRRKRQRCSWCNRGSYSGSRWSGGSRSSDGSLGSSPSQSAPSLRPEVAPLGRQPVSAGRARAAVALV